MPPPPGKALAAKLGLDIIAHMEEEIVIDQDKRRPSKFNV